MSTTAAVNRHPREAVSRSLKIVEAGTGGPRYTPSRTRRVLCVFPRYAPSFGTFQHAYALVPGVRAFMPPQGLLLIAAYLPPSWSVRFVDENLHAVSRADMEWADAVLISGMHVQRPRIQRLIRMARQAGAISVVGGPSVSACPDHYPQADVLHVGELGDATDELIRLLDGSTHRPARQIVLNTSQRMPMQEMPLPAYHLIDLRRYFLGSIQFSSGCPYRCDFCDIPALYGRKPRFKQPQQIIAELDLMLSRGLRNAVYFVDDNFVANPAAAAELTPHLVKWQQRTGYQVNLCCEATLNMTRHAELLAQMREARFTTVFCGIETPDPDALAQMDKKQNLSSPILDSVRKLNDHGMEVVSGIILGLDSDTPDTADRLTAFIEASHIPMLTINLLYALPKTPLYDRLKRKGRLNDDPSRASNVEFKMPYEQVLGMWRDVIRRTYEPRRLFERFAHQAEACFPNRPAVRRRLPPALIASGLATVARSLWAAGVKADHRRAFWDTCGPLLRRGRVEDVTHIGVMSHHLIRFARECVTENAEPSFYSEAPRGEGQGSGARVRGSGAGVTSQRSESGLTSEL